jgi:SAM-dependent methyltransferase
MHGWNKELKRMKKQPFCPHCGTAMDPIQMPLESSWGGEIHYVCFNDQCCYFIRSWDTLEQQGVERTGYRCRMDPRGSCGPLAVWSADAIRNRIVCEKVDEETVSPEFRPDDFARDDESPDAEFYKQPRFVDHLDSLALSTVEDLYVRLVPKGARVLDLMAGPDSHLRSEIAPHSLAGLGLNEKELAENTMLTTRVMHDLNANPKLPFADNEFDAVLNTVSVDYMTHPVEVFREVGRILKPGGVFVVVFSNRMFPPKAVKVWKNTNEADRVDLVKRYVHLSGSLSIQGYFESTGKPRPKDDKYYALGIPSDPIYAIWATATEE